MRKLFCFLTFIVSTILVVSCQKDVEETRPENDPADILYGIWNRTEFGFRSCAENAQNTTQFGDGSVGFDPGGFYSTYSIRDGKDRINTVRFEAESDSILFLATETKWGFMVDENQLVLTTNATNGCVRYFEFSKSQISL